MKLYQSLSLNDIKGNKELLQVWRLACLAHKGQKRLGVNEKGEQVDYVTHPYRVMEILANALGNPKVEIQKKKNLTLFATALLHDTIEDTYLSTPQKLTLALKNHTQVSNPEEIAFYVQELSNPAEGFMGNTNTERDQAKAAWQKNHVQNISIIAKMVKMADQISNSIDCAELSTTTKNKQDKIEDIWSLGKKLFNIEKAMHVCVSCLIGTEKASAHDQNILKHLLDFEKQAFFYAALRVEKPNYFHQSFYTQSVPLPTRTEKKTIITHTKQLSRKYIRFKREAKTMERNR